MFLEKYMELRDYLELGGEVLFAILFICLWLWGLIIERFFYIWISFPRDAR